MAQNFQSLFQVNKPQLSQIQPNKLNWKFIPKLKNTLKSIFKCLSSTINSEFPALEAKETPYTEELTN